MTSLATLPRPDTRALSPVDLAALDRLSVPAATCSIADARPRSCVVVDVRVERVEPRRWIGGPVLEVVVGDPTGSLVLGFLGRRAVRGIAPGRRLVAGGTVGARGGRLMMLNPVFWLTPLDETATA